MYDAYKTTFGTVAPNKLVGYNQGVSVDPNGKWDPTTGVWSANGRQMVWNPRYNQWVIVSGDGTPGSSGGGGAAAAPSNPNGGYATSAVAAKPDRSNDIAVQNAGLGSVDEQVAAGIKAVNDAAAKLKGQYAEETTANEKNYTDQSTTNQSNLQKNRQTAMVNAAQGRQGLFGTLASIGALNGSGITLANNAVQKGANIDLSGAADNYGANQSQLDTAIGTYRLQDKRRNQDADTAATDAIAGVNNNAAKSRLNFYNNLVGDYTDMGDKANAAKYTQLAASLYPELAKTSVPSSNLSYTGASFTPGTLSDYVANADNTQVNTTPTNGNQTIPGLYASTKKKDKNAAVTAA